MFAVRTLRTFTPGIAEEVLAFFKFFIVIANFGNYHVDLVPSIDLFASACPQAICPGRFLASGTTWVAICCRPAGS